MHNMNHDYYNYNNDSICAIMIKNRNMNIMK